MPIRKRRGPQKEDGRKEIPALWSSAYPTATSTFFPLKATPYLQTISTPLALSSVSYPLSLICFRAVSERAWSWLSEQPCSAFSSMMMPGSCGEAGQSWIS